MNKYVNLKNKHQKEVNEFPIGAAFSNEQFNEMMVKWNLKETDTDKICSLGCGVFIRKSDLPAFHKMCDRHEAERKEAMQDDEYIYEMFRYELANYEYCITYDYEDTLNALGLTYEEVIADKRLHEALKKAKEDYLNNCD